MKHAVLLLAVVSALVLFAGVAPVSADSPQYLGELCWRIDFGGNGIPMRLQFGITVVGQKYLALTGWTNAFGVLVPVQGSAAFSGNQIIIGYTFSSPFGPGTPTKQVFETGQLTLNNTLNGTADFVDTYFTISSGTFNQVHQSWPVTLTPCI